MDLYWVHSYDAPRVRTGPALGVTSCSIGTNTTNFKIFLLWKWKAYGFDIWYVASPSGPLQSLFMWCPWGQNWPCPRGHMLEHRNKDSKLQNSSLKLEGAELWYLVSSISLWTSTKFVHMMTLGSILAPPLESQDGTQEQSRQTSKFFSLKLFGLCTL